MTDRYFGNHCNWIIQPQCRNPSKIVLEAFGAALCSRFIFAELIYHIYARQCPFEVLDVEALILQAPGNAFPSGHASFFFALQQQYFFYNKKWGALLLLLSLFNNIGRVLAFVHWDIGGALLGILTATAIHRYRRDINTKLPFLEKRYI